MYQQKSPMLCTPPTVPPSRPPLPPPPPLTHTPHPTSTVTPHPPQADSARAQRILGKLSRRLLIRSPLVRLNLDRDPADPEIYLKLENLQPIGSFKVGMGEGQGADARACVCECVVEG